MPTATTDLDLLAINTIRTLSMDAVQKANSGHPGTPMACAPLAWLLFTRHLRHSPANPAWPDRDRFVLSAGHASMLLYSALHLTGYDLPLEELKRFRQWESRTPGHPEHFMTPGVETTTGPLGQGIGNAVGMAIAERHLAARFNRPGQTVVDHRTYVIASDGDMMEGVSHEAAALAGHLGLSRLIVIYDDNHITIEGKTDLAMSEDVGKRYEAYRWYVQRVDDGNDTTALEQALRAAENESERPSFIVMRTHIAYGAPTKHDTAEAHGSPLGEPEVRAAKKFYGWPEDAHFRVPDEVKALAVRFVERGRSLESQWNERFAAWSKEFPSLREEWDRAFALDPPKGWDAGIAAFKSGEKPIATRNASGTVLNAFADKTLFLMGGSADLAPSTKTLLKSSKDFERGAYGERNMHFGVREHGMGATLNGMALHRGVRPYGATFLIFSDYMRPSIRLAALMKLPTIYVFTHDSIGLGEDGPTHQPVEQLAALRAIPGFTLIRPGDANETAEAWRFTMNYKDGPVALVLTRQDLPVFDRAKMGPASGLQHGGYVLSDAEGGRPAAILIATGSEVAIAIAAKESLGKDAARVRVVSLPSFEIFDRQDKAWRDSVLPPAVLARVAVEAASPFGWERYLGDRGLMVGMTTFGASAPYETLYEKFGLTPEKVAAAVKKVLR